MSPEDKLIFAKAQDCYKASQQKGLPAFTDFLNPIMTEALFHLYKDETKVFGGYEDAERKVIGFAPYDILEADFPITPLGICYNTTFSKSPSHRDYLGSVLGLGLERGKIGDIRLADEGAVMYVKHEIAEYVTANLERAGHVKIKVTPNQLLPGLHNSGTSIRLTVASLRLDAVISAAFRLSRGKSAAFIDSDKVMVNWQVATKASKVLNEGDVITIRGFGRVKVEAEAGKTKKDRKVLLVVRY